MSHHSSTSRAGVVIIGRNEAKRLPVSLKALADRASRSIYVDSGSSDGSVALVRSQFRGIQVHELSADRPFSAARARNEGINVLAQKFPELEFVQFVDGDCELVPGWLDQAEQYLRSHPDCAAVVGHLQERFPDASVYNRLCAMEWNSPPGDIEDCGAFGGLSMVRISAFQRAGGFNAQVIAGEDSELAVRMKLNGSRIHKLDAKMAIHDAGMTRFSEFWKRSVRSGHAIGQRFDLHGRGPARDCERDMKSLYVWGMGLPITAICLAILMGAWALVIWPAALAYLFWRVRGYRVSRGDALPQASLYAGSILIAKYAQVIGWLQYRWNRLRGEFRMIEYK
jgi:GT2 family glycosyltransferase